MNTLKTQKRDMTIKAKRLRREGYITGNLYGKKLETSIPLKITQSEADRILKDSVKGSQILLDVEGEIYNVLIKEIDYNPLNRQLMEMDFQALVSNEKVHSVAEVILHNKDKVTDGILEHLLTEVSYRAYPADMVDRINIDVSELRSGDHIKVADLDIAKNEKIDLLTNPDSVVVNIAHSHVEEEQEEQEEQKEEKTTEE